MQYIAKASSDLKLVTHFEINNRFGAPTTASTTGSVTSTDLAGNDIDTDGLNIVTKNAYLDFNAMKGLNLKLGLQAYKDSIGGILVDADLPAIIAQTKVGDINTVLGFARYLDKYTTTPATTGVVDSVLLGDVTGNLSFVDFDYNLNKDTKVGASYYLQMEESTNASTSVFSKKTIHTFGLNAATKIQNVAIKGFVALQNGESTVPATSVTTDYSGYAANLQASLPVAGGMAKAGYLFVSGDTESSATKNNQFQTLGSTGSTFNESGMMLMVRNSKFYPTSTSFTLKGNTVSNIELAYLGYNSNLTDKLALSANVGLGWDNTDVGTTAGRKGAFIGTEVNAELAYKLYKELSVFAQVGYISLGSQYDAYKDPYAVRLGASFSF